MDKIIDRQMVVGGLNQKIGECAEIFEDNTNQSIKIRPEKLVEVMQELRDNPNFDFKLLMNLNSVDYPENFTVVYHLYSISHKHQVTVKVELEKDKPQVPSVTSVWTGANAMEREAFDLMGIVFSGHPNLKRVLLTDDFVGHPLRKDFQLQS